MLLSVRACFHVHLISKNQVNKTTAKAALTQMLSVVNQRMELRDAKAKSLGNTATARAEAEVSRLNTDFHDTITHILEIPPQVVKTVASDNIIYENEKNDGSYAEPDVGYTSDSATSQIPPQVDSIEATQGTVSSLDSNLENSGFDVNSSIEYAFPSVYHKDSFLLFRALCKLSMKSLQDESGNQTDPIALQNKVLSLELILHILQHCGPAFRTGEKFIHATKSYLCVSLLGNCTSQVAQVTTLSLQVFVALMDSFRDHLKSELEVFVTNIFLRILESENSSYEHKIRVMDVLQSIINDPSALVEIFINYDCDFEAIDLFRRIIDAFAKIAKNANNAATRSSVDFMSSSKKGSTEESNIRAKCVDGLVIILKSLLKTAGISLTGEVTVPETGLINLRKIAAASESQTEGDIIVESSPAEDETIPVNGVGAGVVEAFDRKQRVQEEIETGILKFNLSSKKGLSYLVTLGHVEMNPSGVAKFFRHYQDRLDKTAVGEYLGKEREYENGFCLKVLHEYVDNMDFTNMKFDEAIRYFLGGFRLPGEAQKIDRIMEKFAERYYLQNRLTFPSADMAFILAFSTIMLQTNLHNPAIKDDKRMTKEQFIKQNKGISADGELSDEMLKEIYDKISAQPISLNQDDKLTRKVKKEEQSFIVFPLSTDKRRKDAFNDERKEMVRISEAMFKQKLRTRCGNTFVRSAQTDEAYARPMFEVAWPPMLSVFSQLLETTDEMELVTTCLEGVHYSIRLASRIEISIARNTFINTLTKFTTLDTIRPMLPKNIEVIRTLMDTAFTEGEYLAESWNQVLQCVSQLARLQLFANRLHTDDVFFSNQNSDSERRRRNLSRSMAANQSTAALVTDPFTKFFSGLTKVESARQQEESNAEMIMLEIDPLIMDKIFVNSQNLSTESVLHFIKSLCAVSLLEISSSSSMNSLRGRDLSGDTATPRVFSLQKLVEVADFNMHIRPRIAWSNMWSILAAHFMDVGVHDNYALAMYAIDSLKQLSIKFLQKEELSNFNFQRLFLKPFEVIMSRSKSLEIKELILRCLDIMIRACAQNIRSGWRTIFSIFELAASSDKFDIASIAFEITERLMNQQFHLLIYDFVELMNCLVSFVAGSHLSISLGALTHLSKCADHLARSASEPAIISHYISAEESSKKTLNVIGEDASVFRLWWPLLLGLSTRVSDSREEVRNKALDMLLHILRQYGDLFSQQTWGVIFKGVLLPMMDSAKTDFTTQPTSSWPTENPRPSNEPRSWIGTTGSRVLVASSSLFHQFRTIGLTTPLLPDLLHVIEGCICQKTESLARLGLRALYDLVIALIDEADEDRPIDLQTADFVCDRVCSCLARSLCLDFSEVGHVSFDPNTPLETRKLLVECPLSSTRTQRDNRNKGDIGSRVRTLYGEGRVMQVLAYSLLILLQCLYYFYFYRKSQQIQRTKSPLDVVFFCLGEPVYTQEKN